MKNNISFRTSFSNSSSSALDHREVLIYSTEASIVQTVSLVVIAVSGLAGNGYVCRVIQSSNNLKNPTVMFILNLALANIGALALCTPLPLAISIKRWYFVDPWWCMASGFLNNFFFCASIFTLSLITTHKYFTVVKPATCTCLRFTDKRPKLCLVGIWISCTVVSFVALGPFSGWGYITFNATTAHCGISFPVTITQKFRLAVLAMLAFIIPLSLMGYAYWRIYSKVNAHERRLSNAGTINHASPVKKKLTITLCLMFGTFVACWSPFFLLIAMAIVLKEPSDLPFALGRFAYWFGYINCSINPVVYCMRTSTFKEMMRGRSTSLQTFNGTEPHKRRAQSLPILSTKSRRMSTITVAALSQSAAISPTRAFLDTRSSKSPQIPQNLRVPRMRAFSWTANYTVAEKIGNDIQESQKTAQKQTRLPSKDDKKKIHMSQGLRTNFPPTIVESPLEVASSDEHEIHFSSLVFSPYVDILPNGRKISCLPKQTALELKERI